MTKGYCHKCTTKKKHEKEVSRFSTERSLLQHTTVTVSKDEVE